MAPKDNSNAPLIKGYLPVRLKLPSKPGSLSTDETFFYVKEHQTRRSNNHNKHDDVSQPQFQNDASTLFVCNAPVVPPIRTRLLLKSLFGRFGAVRKVTVVENPRTTQTTNSSIILDRAAVPTRPTFLWTKKFPSAPSYLCQPSSEGKFAYVEFDSNKDMKRAYKLLVGIMSGETREARHGADHDDEDAENDDLPGLSMDNIEIQTLADESDRQIREEKKKLNADIADQSENDEDASFNEQVSSLSPVSIVAERYRSSFMQLAQNREALLEECNAVMQEFEDAEEQARLAHQRAAYGEPDDDGFVTVSYSASANQGKRELEEQQPQKSTGAESDRRKKGQKRSRKKNKSGSGASELPDFYRFQTKTNRKRAVHELRERFEEDLAKIKKMKEDGQYRPF